VSQLLKQESEETVKNTAATWSTVPGHHWLERTERTELAVQSSIYTVA